MERYIPLSLNAQTAYAETFDMVLARTTARSVADLNGSFAKKQVKGATYWYFQFRDIDGRVRQIYIGPDNERVQKLITDGRAAPVAAADRLARSALALGCAGILPKHFAIIRRLAEYGFFKAGGVLIGTHAFISMGNMLGMSWRDGARTQDVDFAQAGKSISIGLPADIEVDIHAALDSLEMGFIPIQSFSGNAGATYLNPKEPELRIDFLAPANRSGDGAFNFDQLNIALQPLKFMEFSLENTTQAALLSRDGAVLINLPSPLRYGLHKLLVYGERTVAFRTKSAKDLLQSAALLSYSAANQPAELKEGLKDLLGRGPGWRKRAEQGISALLKIEPALEEFLRPAPAGRGVARKSKRPRPGCATAPRR